MTKISFCAALAAVVLCGVFVSVALAQQGNPGYPAAQQANPGYPPSPQANQGYTQYRQPGPAAQPAAQPPMGAPVGLVDIGHILERSSRIKSEQEAMKARMKEVDNALMQEQDAIRKLQEQLREFNSGTNEYKQREAEIATRFSQLQVNAKLERKRFDEQRAQLLYKAYKEIEQEVQAVAAQRGFVMVLRFTGADVPQDNLEAVYMFAGKPVVWFNPGLNITDEVLQRLEQRAGYGGQPNMSSTQSRPGIPMQPRR
ncbi:MAG TPA: OmpH family outer membrane protein [Thermoguttaceae bacterium]|nr:OmpH family outer membrane protein [Thermoguttaceae bacterium]